MLPVKKLPLHKYAAAASMFHTGVRAYFIPEGTGCWSGPYATPKY